MRLYLVEFFKLIKYELKLNDENLLPFSSIYFLNLIYLAKYKQIKLILQQYTFF